MNDNNYLSPLPSKQRQLQQPQPRIDVQHVDAPPRFPPTALVPNMQLRRLEQHQLQLRHIRQRQEQERLQRLCLEEERQRQEQQRALERQRRELLQLQLQQQQQEHRLRRQLLQRQLEMEQQQRVKQQPQVKGQPPCLLSPSSGLCTIYEAMETSEEEEDAETRSGSNQGSSNQTGQSIPTDLPLRVANGNLRRPPPQELDWNTKLDMVQQLINQTMLLTGEDDCPPLLYLPGQGGGILSPLESSLWPHIMSHFDCSTATVSSVSSFSPRNKSSSQQGDWTVVELETHH